MSQTNESRRRSPLRLRLLLSGCTLLFLLLLAEGGLRLLGWGQIMVFAPHAEFGYSMVPGQTVWSYGLPVRINALGLRGPEVGPKQDGMRRILFVGDSVTYGGGRVAEGDLFCRQVEAHLRAAGEATEVVNVSAPGWSPQNWQAWLKEHGFLEADRVVLTFPECDLHRPFSTMAMHGFEADAPCLRSLSIAMKLLRTGPDNPYAGADPEEALRKNAAAVSWLQENAPDLLLVCVPSARPGASAADWEAVTEAASKQLDLHSLLNDPALYQDGIHLNARGHAVAGQAIAAALLDTSE